MTKLSSQTIKIVSLAILILLIFVAIFYFVGRKGGNLTLGSPADAAEEFIEVWHERGTLQGKSLSEKISMSSNLVTRDFTMSLGSDDSEVIDSATCLYNQKGRVRLVSQEVDKESGQATINASQELSDDSSQGIVIELIASGGAWRVSKVSCANDSR